MVNPIKMSAMAMDTGMECGHRRSGQCLCRQSVSESVWNPDVSSLVIAMTHRLSCAVVIMMSKCKNLQSIVNILESCADCIEWAPDFTHTNNIAHYHIITQRPHIWRSLFETCSSGKGRHAPGSAFISDDHFSKHDQREKTGTRPVRATLSRISSDLWKWSP